MIILTEIIFWISNPKSIFGQIWGKKYVEDADSYSHINFLNFQP